jgi:4-amino-4-deoxy-L-arabinose transferase-like glycosyltransferase
MKSLAGVRHAMVRWLDAGRSSLVVVLGLALAVPSINALSFDGLPLDNPPEAIALALLLPFAFSAFMRQALPDFLQRRNPKGRRLLLTLGVVVIVVKLILLAAGSDRGFVGCYSSPASNLSPRPPRCEASYGNWLRRHGSATRVDPHIDFGPSGTQASELVTAYPTYVYRGGLAASNWNVSFPNDLRFNHYDKIGLARHERLPLKVEWRGKAEVPGDGLVRIRYVGVGILRIGQTRLRLARSTKPRTVALRARAGNQSLRADFRFADRAPLAAKSAAQPYGELRLLDAEDRPLAASSQPTAVRLVAGAVDIAMAFAFLVLLVVLITALGPSAWSLGAIAALAGLAAWALPSGFETYPAGAQDYVFMALAALLAPALVWRPPRRPILWAYAALLILNAVRLLADVPDLHAVLYRTSGTDFLTYESFARDVVLGHSLQGGEGVFFYQPGSRYLLGPLHLLLGDGDVLITVWWMVALGLVFAALISWHRRRWTSTQGLGLLALAGALLLGLVNSSTVLSLAAQGASEVAIWVLFPLAIAAPQLRPSRAGPWIGSAAAASLTWVVRADQAFGVLTILAATGAALGRARRKLLVGAAAAAAGVALLPAFHNAVYGHRLVPATTGSTAATDVSPLELTHIFSDASVADRLEAHVRHLLYVPHGAFLSWGHLRWLLWGLMALWVAAIVKAVLLRRSRPLSAPGWVLLFLPIAYLAPYLFYIINNVYPRHILLGYLAMGVSGLGALAELSAKEVVLPRLRRLGAAASEAVGRWVDVGRSKHLVVPTLGLAALAFLVRLPFLLGDYTSAITPDSPFYIQIAAQLPGTIDTEAIRTLGYPLFIWPLSVLPGSTGDAVVVVQHLLGIVLVAGVFLAADRYFGRLPAIFAALMTALAPPILLTEHYVQPDLLFALVVLAGAVALIETALPERQSLGMLILVGVLFGLAAHVKPTGQALIVVPPLVLGFATRSWWKTLRGSGAIAGAMVAVVLPWVVYNAVRYDQLEMSGLGGQALWLRVFDQDKRPIPTDSADGRLAKRFYEDYLADPPPNYYQDPQALAVTESYSYVYNSLQSSRSKSEALDTQGNLATQAIRAYPFGYLKGTIRNVQQYVRYNTGPHGFSEAEGFDRQHIAPAPRLVQKLATGAWGIAGLLGTMLFLALLAAPLLIFTGARRSRIAAVALLATWAAVAVSGSLTNSVQPRFAVQIGPLQWILAAAAAVLVVSVARRWRLPWSGYATAGAISLAPLWSVQIVSHLILGRLLMGVIALAFAVDVIQGKRMPKQIPRLLMLFIAALVVLEAWTLINATAWGCLQCNGDFGGFSDLAFAAVLLLCVFVTFPRSRTPAVIAMVCAAVPAILLAGVGEFGSSAPAIAGGRLGGIYGNPNDLALALTPAIPALVAFRREGSRRERLAILGICALLCVPLLLTFSRMGLISVAAGVILVLTLQSPPARRTRTVGLLVLAFIGTAAIAYPVVQHVRRSHYVDPSSLTQSIDRSGWDGTAQGPIPRSPARMANDRSVKELRAQGDVAGTGLNHPFGSASPQATYTLTFSARETGPRHQLLRFRLQENYSPDGSKIRQAKITDAWTTHSVTWKPSALSHDPRLYVWQPNVPADFSIRDVTVTRTAAGLPEDRQVISPRLLGPPSADELSRRAGADESAYSESRRKAADLALSAFSDHPVRGIGWAQFTSLADRRLPFGPFPTHNEYLRFAAELGTIGFLLLLGLGAVIIAALRRNPASPLRDAVAGMLLAGAISLLFINGLVFPAAAFWLVVASCLAVSGARTE